MVEVMVSRRDNDADENVNDSEETNAHATAVPGDQRPLTLLRGLAARKRRLTALRVEFRPSKRPIPGHRAGGLRS
jgi:hypothetical protein